MNQLVYELTLYESIWTHDFKFVFAFKSDDARTAEEEIVLNLILNNTKYSFGKKK